MFSFTPSLEPKNQFNPEPLIRNAPVDVLKAGEFQRVPILMTVNKDEGVLLHSAGLATYLTLSILKFFSNVESENFIFSFKYFPNI